MLGESAEPSLFFLRGYSGLGLKCPNAPHLWQLGWTQPLADFSIQEMAYGESRTYYLPVALAQQQNVIRLQGSPEGTYYLSFRRSADPYEQVGIEDGEESVRLD
jgi:hypothetical protein